MSKIPSEFVPLDVNYVHDAALREAGPMAELLFIRALAYCRRTKSVGFIPDYDIPVVGVGIPNPKKHAQTLTRVAVWTRVDRGFTVRSWAKWNPSTTKEVKEKQSEGGVRGNHARWHVNGVTSDDCPLCPSAPDRSTDRSTDRSLIGVTRSVSDRLPITEVELEREGEIKSKACPPAPPSDEFDEFWTAYPRKVGKEKARPAFAKAARSAGAKVVIDGARRLASDPNLPERQFIPHPCTWLNRGGWDDEPLPPQVKPTHVEQPRRGVSVWDKRVGGDPA